MTTPITAPHPRYRELPDPKSSKTLRASGLNTGMQQTSVSVRDFRFLADEPVAVGGRDLGPTPMEYLAGGVISCITVVIDQLAQRQGIAIDEVQTYALARQDTRGLAGTADVQPYFHRFHLQIALATREQDERRLHAFAAEAERICPAINLLRDAHTGLEVHWAIADTLPQRAAESLANAACGYRTDGAEPPAPRLTISAASSSDALEEVA